LQANHLLGVGGQDAKRFDDGDDGDLRAGIAGQAHAVFDAIADSSEPSVGDENVLVHPVLLLSALEEDPERPIPTLSFIKSPGQRFPTPNSAAKSAFVAAPEPSYTCPRILLGNREVPGDLLDTNPKVHTLQGALFALNHGL
jgi:hypothetical protein